jgi:hypothetical protein
MPIRSYDVTETLERQFSKFSANVCSVTVLPVPVAPVISPWRLASPAAARGGVGSFRDQHRFSHEGALG